MPSQVPGNKMGIQDSATSFSPLPFPSSALRSHQQHLQFWDCCVLLGVHGLAQVFCLLVITSVNHASSCLHFCPCVCSWLFLSIPAQAIITSHFHAHSDGHYKPWRYWFELHFFFTPLQPCPPGTCHSRSYLSSRVFLLLLLLPWAWQHLAVLWPTSRYRCPRLPQLKAEVKLYCRCDWLNPIRKEDFDVASPSWMSARWNYIKKPFGSEINEAQGKKRELMSFNAKTHSSYFYNGNQ